MRDKNGSLYGTTLYGGTGQCAQGPTGCGVVFKLDAVGNYSVLHRFTGGADGGVPEATLWQNKHGTLYGTTAGGGRTGNGVVFKMIP